MFGWVVADSGYGRDPKLRDFCHQQQLAYVFAVPVDLPLVDVRDIAARPDAAHRPTPTPHLNPSPRPDEHTRSTSATGRATTDPEHRQHSAKINTSANPDKITSIVKDRG